MKFLDLLTKMVIAGCLSWGLVGLLNFDLVAAPLGDITGLARTVYSLVGISAVYQAIRFEG